MSVLQGATVDITLTVKDGAGALSNPASVVLELKKPDGTLLSLTPTHSSVGKYVYRKKLDQAGRWIRKWTTTGNDLDGVFETWVNVIATEIP